MAVKATNKVTGKEVKFKDFGSMSADDQYLMGLGIAITELADRCGQLDMVRTIHGSRVIWANSKGLLEEG